MGGPLDAACHGHSETLVFALIRWMVDEKSSNHCFIRVLLS